MRILCSYADAFRRAPAAMHAPVSSMSQYSAPSNVAALAPPSPRTTQDPECGFDVALDPTPHSAGHTDASCAPVSTLHANRTEAPCIAHFCGVFLFLLSVHGTLMLARYVAICLLEKQ